MSQPVKLSDDLVLDARLTAEIAERSIAGQIEFWAQLGRAIEPLLQGAQALALLRAGAAVPLSACLQSVVSPGSSPVRSTSWASRSGCSARMRSTVSFLLKVTDMLLQFLPACS